MTIQIDVPTVTEAAQQVVDFLSDHEPGYAHTLLDGEGLYCAACGQEWPCETGEMRAILAEAIESERRLSC